VDVAAAMKVLNWKPAVSLEEGLARTTAAFRKGP
jgi:nucleoside-diphosphate-sugar epimerase